MFKEDFSLGILFFTEKVRNQNNAKKVILGACSQEQNFLTVFEPPDRVRCYQRKRFDKTKKFCHVDSKS